MNSSIYINGIDSLDDYMVQLSHRGGHFVAGILSSPQVAFETGANYDTNPLNTSGITQEAAGAVEKKLTGGSRMTDAAAEASISHSSTTRVYRGSADNGITVNFKVFLNKFGMPSTWAAIEAILNFYTQPRIIGNQLNSNLYDVEEAAGLIFDGGKIDALDGKLCKIFIGKWFETPAVMYVSNIGRTYAAYSDINGRPLYLELSVTLTPYRTLLFDDPVWLKL